MTATTPIPIRANLAGPTSADVPVSRYLGLLLAPGIGSFAFNAATVSTPQLLAEFGGSEVAVELVIAGYGIPFAVFLILGGRLGDRFGRHRLFLLGTILFAVGALASSLAPSLAVLIAARVEMGIAAALLTPQVLATIQATSTGAARVRAIAAFGASGGIGGALGQVLGGALAGMSIGAISGWRTVYWLIAVGAVVAAILSSRAPHSALHEDVDIDLVGTLLLGFGMFLLSAGLTFGPKLSWNGLVIAALVLGVGLLVALWKHQDRIERSGHIPLLPPSIMRLRPLQLTLTITCLFFAAYAGILFVIPRAFAQGLGIDAFGSGLALMPFAIVFAVTSLSLVRIQRRLGAATLLWGTILQAIAMLGVGGAVWFAWNPQLPLILQPALVLLGVGQAMVFGSLAQEVVKSIPPEAAGLSGGLFGTVQQLCLSLGVILLGGIVVATGWLGQIEFAAGVTVHLVCVALSLVVSVILLRSRTVGSQKPDSPQT